MARSERTPPAPPQRPSLEAVVLGCGCPLLDGVILSGAKNPRIHSWCHYIIRRKPPVHLRTDSSFSETAEQLKGTAVVQSSPLSISGLLISRKHARPAQASMAYPMITTSPPSPLNFVVAMSQMKRPANTTASNRTTHEPAHAPRALRVTHTATQPATQAVRRSATPSMCSFHPSAITHKPPTTPLRQANTTSHPIR